MSRAWMNWNTLSGAFMTDASRGRREWIARADRGQIRRQNERERRERVARAEERQRLERERLAAEQREQQRIAELKNQWPRVLAARATATLGAYQLASYNEKARRLGAIAHPQVTFEQPTLLERLLGKPIDDD